MTWSRDFTHLVLPNGRVRRVSRWTVVAGAPTKRRRWRESGRRMPDSVGPARGARGGGTARD